MAPLHNVPHHDHLDHLEPQWCDTCSHGSCATSHLQCWEVGVERQGTSCLFCNSEKSKRVVVTVNKCIAGTYTLHILYGQTQFPGSFWDTLNEKMDNNALLVGEGAWFSILTTESMKYLSN